MFHENYIIADAVFWFFHGKNMLSRLQQPLLTLEHTVDWPDDTVDTESVEALSVIVVSKLYSLDCKSV